MNSGSLPLALLCAALGLALAKTPPKTAVLAIAVLVATSLLSFTLMPIDRWETPAVVALWISVAITAGLAYRPRDVDSIGDLLASINAGLWVGAVAPSSGGVAGIASAWPFALLFLPAAWLSKTKRGVAVKVVASWVIAVSILAGMVAISPVPGYAPDHME